MVNLKKDRKHVLLDNNKTNLSFKTEMEITRCQIKMAVMFIDCIWNLNFLNIAVSTKISKRDNIVQMISDISTRADIIKPVLCSR
jgi:hypothetical protein